MDSNPVGEFFIHRKCYGRPHVQAGVQSCLHRQQRLSSKGARPYPGRRAYLRLLVEVVANRSLFPFLLRTKGLVSRRHSGQFYHRTSNFRLQHSLDSLRTELRPSLAFCLASRPEEHTLSRLLTEKPYQQQRSVLLAHFNTAHRNLVPEIPNARE